MAEPLAPKRIQNWPDAQRWHYGGAEYRQLEGVQIGDEYGTLTFLFGLTWRERLRLLFGRGVYVSVMAFRQPLQPLRVDVSEPEFFDGRREQNNAE